MKISSRKIRGIDAKGKKNDEGRNSSIKYYNSLYVREERDWKKFLKIKLKIIVKFGR